MDISERITDLGARGLCSTALRHKREKRQPYSPTPYGFDRICDMLVINHDEQKVIEEILELREKGWSLRQIAGKLNQAGVESKRGGLWFASTVRSVLVLAGGR